MNAIIYIAIIQIGVIAKLLFFASAVFFAYHGRKYVMLWWGTPSDQPVVYGFWTRLRRQTITALFAFVLSVCLPSREDAIAQYVGYKVANASIWDRMFQGDNRQTMERELRRAVEGR